VFTSDSIFVKSQYGPRMASRASGRNSRGQSFTGQLFEGALAGAIKHSGPSEETSVHQTKFCCNLNGKAKTYIIMAALFFSITAGQYFAAIASNSLALKADCISMLVDALSYCGNLVAECVSEPVRKERTELLTSAISFILLGVFTALFIKEAVDNILPSGGKDDSSDDVNPYIVIGFAILGLSFDFLGLLAYKYWGMDGHGGHGHDHGKHRVGEEGEHSQTLGHGHGHGQRGITGEESSQQNGHGHGHGHGHGQLGNSAEDHSCGNEDGRSQSHGHVHGHGHGRVRHILSEDKHSCGRSEEDHSQLSSPNTNANMMSALFHVLSDLARSTTTLIEAIVILSIPSISSTKADGWSALIVCSLIALGTLYGFYEWVLEMRAHCQRSQQNPSLIGYAQMP